MTKVNQTTEINFIESNGAFMVSSLEIAKHFERKHYNILKNIEKIKRELSLEFIARNFECVSYKDNKGKVRPYYKLTRDAFFLLTMSGKKALEWKVKYIEAFNTIGENKEDTVSSVQKKLLSQENYFL